MANITAGNNVTPDSFELAAYTLIYDMISLNAKFFQRCK